MAAKSSPPLQDVSITLRLMGVEHQMEAQQTDQRRIDILIPSLKDGGPDVALEVDGATHFAVNKPWHKLGNTALRNRQLERAGLRVVSVHHLDWRDATSMTKREQYLRGLLVDAGAVAEKAGS